MFQSASRNPVLLLTLALLAGCSEAPDAGDTGPHQPPPITDGGIPLSTNSEAVMVLYNKARDALDRGNIVDANQTALQLTQAYPDFAGGWLMLTGTSLSGEQFVRASKRALAKAEAGGTTGEKLWAAVNRAFVANNTDKALRIADELTRTYPRATRGWMVLSSVQAARAEHEAARASLNRAIELDPASLAAYTALGLSYLYNSPKDLGLAEAVSAEGCGP